MLTAPSDTLLQRYVFEPRMRVHSEKLDSRFEVYDYSSQLKQALVLQMWHLSFGVEFCLESFVNYSCIKTGEIENNWISEILSKIES